MLSVFRSTGVEIVAEDLGTVPDFVRESLARAVIPGYKVFRLGAPLAHAGAALQGPARVSSGLRRDVGHA